MSADFDAAERELRTAQRLNGGSSDEIAFEWALLQAAGVADVLGPVLSPQRKPNEPVSPLWFTPSCVVQNGREAQRITFDEQDVPVPNQPSACPQRIAIDFRFQYHRL